MENQSSFGALGAEIHNVDLGKATPAELDEIRNLLTEHMVLFFPSQDLSVAEHVKLGEHFGEIEGHPNLKNPVEGFPEIFELRALK